MLWFSKDVGRNLFILCAFASWRFSDLTQRRRDTETQRGARDTTHAKAADSDHRKRQNQHLCGPPVFLRNKESWKIHLKKAKEGLKIAHRVLDEKQADLLVLDEILYAVKFGLLAEDDVLELLEKRGGTAIILSGREPGDRIIEMADIVTHTEQINYHWDKNSGATSMI
ncbi:MAG: cob(I)yrinic acid a,c-diamide adenosyltransferase [Euryarchaeota archaeon]|nr:cob(I)yrinic acid a,c-diamide adenosyltransferase [Euryarchaeota archaeon]